MTGLISQFGIKTESVFGTPIAVDRFYEFTECDLDAEVDSIEGEGLRTSSDSTRADRVVPFVKGAKGSVKFEVLSKSYGLLLGHCLGLPVTTGPVTSAYTHFMTAATGSTNGRSFTAQVGKPYAGGAAQPFTYDGGKIGSFELSNDLDGLLMLTTDMDFRREQFPSSPSGATALQSATYTSGMELMSALGGTITVGGAAQANISKVSIKVDNGLKLDRRFIQASAAKSDQLQVKRREITFTATQEFTDRAHYDRYTATLAASRQAAGVASWAAPTLIGGSTYPSLTVNLPALDFRGAGPLVKGPDLLTQEITAKGLWHPSNGSLSIVYVSADSAA